MDFKSTSELLIKLNKKKTINLYVKLRPQVAESKWQKFCEKEKIKYFEFENLDQVNQSVCIDYFVANVSTAILESTLYGAMPLKIISKKNRPKLYI